MAIFIRNGLLVVALLFLTHQERTLNRVDAFKESGLLAAKQTSSSLLLFRGRPKLDYRHGQNPLFLTGGGGNENGITENSSSNPLPPASQTESLRNLAKSLNFFGQKSVAETSSASMDAGEERTTAPKSIEKVYAKSVAAGLAVSLAMVPEAISFAYVAGVSPLVGLWTTVILGFVAAAFGGRPGICSSASGACSVVVAALCVKKGPSYLSACAMLAGVLQIVFRRAGRFIRLVPHPVMLGFVNGLTLVMARAQLRHFKDAGTGAFLTLSSEAGRSMYGLTALTAILVRLFPRIKALQSIPPTLGAVTVCSVLQKLCNLPGVKTLADVSGAETFRGGWSVLPKLSLWPSGVPFSLETLRVIAPYAVTMASVGAIESLLTMQLLDNLVDTDGKQQQQPSSTRKECLGQGLGNLASGLTGGIGGCALLGQSIINVESGGGASKLSGMSMAVFLALGIVAGAPLLANIPVAALVGVMLTVCQSTFSWSSLRILHKIPRLDAAVIFLVSFVTVKDDLARAVFAGVIASALGFAWKQSTDITATIGSVPSPQQQQQQKTKQKTRGSRQPPLWKCYKVRGPLFFGSTTSFTRLFTGNMQDDPDNVVLDFTESRVYDHSALEAIHGIADKYNEAGKKVHLKHLSDNCRGLLETLHGREDVPYELDIESDPTTDPVYSVAAK